MSKEELNTGEGTNHGGHGGTEESRTNPSAWTFHYEIAQGISRLRIRATWLWEGEEGEWR